MNETRRDTWPGGAARVDTCRQIWRLCRWAKRDRGLGGVAQERQRLLQVELHGVGVVAEGPDRDVSAQLQAEVAAPGGKHEGAIDGRRPDDVAVDQPVQVLPDRISVFGGLADL